MSEFAWEAEVAPTSQSEPQSGHESGPDFHPEPAAPQADLTLSAVDFSALEQRILRAVEVVRRERETRAAAEERAARAEAELREQAPLKEQLEKELHLLRAERDHVRQRVERLLGQLDALAL